MMSWFSFNGVTNRGPILLSALAISVGFLWAGGAVSGENPRFEAEQLRVEALAERQDTRPEKLGDVYLGSAPWICTPSGFGQTATCFERSEIRVSSNE